MYQLNQNNVDNNQGELLAQRLLHNIANGAQNALVELYSLYSPAVFSYLLQLVDDQGLAEEILQDTWLAVWKAAKSFEGRASIRTWLFSIARYQAFNSLRKHSAINLVEWDEEKVVQTISDNTGLEPEELILGAASRLELVQAIRQLSPILREVLVLFFVEELSYQQVAEVLGVPLGTVKSRLSNAKRALRIILEADNEFQKRGPEKDGKGQE